MFNFDSSELLVLGVVAILVIPPKDLPKALRTAGYWVGRARGVARQFRSGFDTMLRDAELSEMEKRWATENERIMRDHPATPTIVDTPVAPAIEHQSMVGAANEAELPPPHRDDASVATDQAGKGSHTS